MATSVREEMLRYIPGFDDPELRERRRHMAKVLLESAPDLRQEMCDEGRVDEARRALRRVLSRRRLVLTPADEVRIETCRDLTTLERWHDQAIEATSAREALQ